MVSSLSYLCIIKKEKLCNHNDIELKPTELGKLREQVVKTSKQDYLFIRLI